MKIQAGLSEGQVLQRLGRKGASFQLRGICEGEGSLHVSIFKQRRALRGWKNKKVGKSAKGKFQASVQGVPAGGPYRLELRVGKERASIQVFFVGDVWLMAGQSNMQGFGDMTGAPQSHPRIRSLAMNREWVLATEPLHVMAESPDAVHHGGAPFTAEEARHYRRHARKGVGPGILFAREMLKRTGVPQGLICTAHGSTSMSQWDPAKKKEGGASLYGSMLLSVQATGQPIAGMLWYQGESDATASDRPPYTNRMKKLVAATRRDLRQPSLPWLIMQIGRMYGGSESAAWNEIQDDQRLLPGQIKNLETISVIDLPLDDSSHVGSLGYASLGSRMAHVADRLVFRNKKAFRPPQLREVRLNYSTKTSLGFTGPSLDIVFDHVGGALRSGSAAQGFTVLTAEGHVWPFVFKTTLHGKFARLHLTTQPPDGIRVCYGHGVAPICNITDGRDLALPVFGPQRCIKLQAFLPFVTTWRVSDVVADSLVPLGKLECPDFSLFKKAPKTYGVGGFAFSLEGFISDHALWENKSGFAYYSAQIELPEPMKLQFLMGYDGPFRIWLDGIPLFTNLQGSNPCLPDESAKTLALKARRYRITVAMDINRGAAWGFLLRFRRLDVTVSQLKSESFRRPTYTT